MPVRPRMKCLLVVAVSLATSACVSTEHLPQDQVDTPRFDPIGFFSGATEGHGRLKVVFRRTEPTLVDGHGRVAPDGAITLDQIVRRGHDAPTHRTWHLRRVAAGRYVGTLTDATGPVEGEVAGNGMHLAFAMKGGMQAQQWLNLQPDGRVAKNVMIVRKFGLPVARLEETITRK